MKTNEIRIEVKVPRAKAFEFTLEPLNKKLWLPSLKNETVSDDQIKLGASYINNQGTFEITDYEKDVFIELTNNKNSFQCSYSFHKIDEQNTEIVYFEAMFDGSDLKEPMDRRHFEKLKTLLEE